MAISHFHKYIMDEKTKIEFRRRSGRPESPRKGYFYWVGEGEGTEILFSPTEDGDDLILLNGGDVELTDSDYDKIAEKVNEKTLSLKWKEI